MRWLYGCLLLATAVACAPAETREEVADPAPPETLSQEEEKAALEKAEPGGTYGRGLGEAETVAIADLAARGPEYLGKTVRVEGTVRDVCPKRGCWMDMEDAAGNSVKIKVVDGEIVFPMSAKGHPAVAEGKLTKFELEGEEAVDYLAHLAEERGEELDPADVPEGPLVVWQIEGSGAVIEDP